MSLAIYLSARNRAGIARDYGYSGDAPRAGSAAPPIALAKVDLSCRVIDQGLA
jgi:hypothetical protein